MPPHIEIPHDALRAICERWKVTNLTLFGSALRDDFSPESDIDLLVEFVPDARLSLFDIVELKEALEELFGRPVDLVEPDTIRNPFRRRSIFENTETIYAA